MNLNFVQTLLSALLVAIPAFLVGFGCTTDATGAVDCSQSTLSPMVVTVLLGFISLLKFVIIPAIQPGGWFRNLFSPKEPV